MDYKVLTQKKDLDSTGYIEIGPGKYSGYHWQDGFIFIWEDAFNIAEGIIIKYFANYDHFSMNDIPYEIGLKIINGWRNVAQNLNELNPEEACQILNLSGPYWDRLDNEIASHREDIIEMLNILANKCEEFYTNNKWICILGI
jgi:hypothetical protein